VVAEGDWDERMPISTVLPGVRLHPLEYGARPTFVFALIKYQDAEGEGWSYRTSGAPNREELLGALNVQYEVLKRELMRDWD
jgi:hypothetical protein